MNNTNYDKTKRTLRILDSTAVLLIALVIVLLYFSQALDFSEITAPFESLRNSGTTGVIPETLTKAQKAYISFRNYMENIEKSIVYVDNKWIFFLLLTALFLSKSLVSVIPISITCLLSGLVFDFPIALAINVWGMLIIITIKYFWGKKITGGYALKIINRYPFIKSLINIDGKPNPWTLFIFRLVPSFPINPVSQLYGYMGYSFPKYILISMAGFSIKLISFTCIGCNVANPFSAAFIVPLIIILLVSGISMLVVDHIVSKNIKRKQAIDDAGE